MRGRVVIAAVSLVLALAATSWASDRDDEAKRLFLEANSKVDAGDLEGALADYQAAFELVPRAKILINIGAVLTDLKRDAELANNWQIYLKHPDRDPKRVPKIRAALERLDHKVGLLKIIVAPSSTVLVDGKTVAVGPDITLYRVEPGRHEITETFETGNSTREVVAKPGTKTTIELKPPPPVTDEDEDHKKKPPPPPPPPPSKPFYKRPWIYTAALTLGSGAVGTYYGLGARTTEDDYQKLVADGQAEYATAKTLQDRGNRRATIANIGFISAGAFAVATGVFVYLDLSSDDDEGSEREIAVAPLSDGGAMVVRGWTF